MLIRKKRWATFLVAIVGMLTTGGNIFAEEIKVLNTDDAGADSLRAAITEANSDVDEDTIVFEIPGDGVQTIELQSALPSIEEPLIIDGYSQGDASENTSETANNAVLLIELDGTDAVGADGLTVVTDGVTIQGLIINNFDGNGIVLSTADADDNIIRGNFIGTNATGTSDEGNGENGILIEGDDNTIGGTAASARNVISGNGENGVYIHHDPQPPVDNVILGNFIGTTKSGTQALGNDGAGVRLETSNDTTVGGTADGSGNVIAFNGEDGVQVAGAAMGVSTGNNILGNAIFSNDELGIDLFPNGVTQNDDEDPDDGNNDLSNFPVLTSAVSDEDELTVEGSLNALPNTTYRLEFFVSENADPSGFGEGQRFIGSRTVETNADGDVEFTFTSLDSESDSDVVTATATDEDDNTSEFSRAIDIICEDDDDDDDDHDDDDEDDDHHGDDDDEINDILFPIPGPLPPPPPWAVWPETAAAVAAPAAAIVEETVGPPVAVAVAEAPVETSVDNAPEEIASAQNDRLETSTNFAPRTEEDLAPEDDASQGCSSTGYVDMSMVMFMLVLFARRRFRKI